MMRWLIPAVALGLSILPAGAHAHAVRACMPRHTVMVLDDGQGEFDGMMHSGLWLVVRNTGTHACSLASVGPVSFEDAHHHPIPVGWRQTVGAPGGVLDTGTQVATALRWVSGNAFDPGYCITPALLALPVHGGMLRQPFGRSLCAPSGAPPQLEQQSWRPWPERQ
ncbi:hypothetical protein Gxy13693_023_018 [Komagataeibacter xylinus NBRC 13693]|uniref:DUF4232 domain-containing protein n=2 Tax=Komagataeibacter TaxID=1434011 RepID=A0A0D6Q9Q3_KOMXY|nr:DUF4232 domain-containing protein [Komagataeibacter xylinus]MBV1824450.1 DUF4232 domain-containing protein [Komagataeibacter oboediens]GAN99546.1 hypothetical protein Gxy13693_023_018 [Komagataeibacter xylinus NBRC 13693]